MPTTLKNPAVGPAPPPGRTQPIRGPDKSDDDQDMEDDDNNDDDEDDDCDYSSPLAVLGPGALAGAVIDLVRQEERDKVYILIDEFI